MKISELILELEKFKEKVGDLTVVAHYDHQFLPIVAIERTHLKPQYDIYTDSYAKDIFRELNYDDIENNFEAFLVIE